MSRLLGLREPEGTNGTFELDYYSKRGVGSGIDVDYAQENRLGHIIGYIINDRGEDRLGRDASRRDLEAATKSFAGGSGGSIGSLCLITGRLRRA